LHNTSYKEKLVLRKYVIKHNIIAINDEIPLFKALFDLIFHEVI